MKKIFLAFCLFSFIACSDEEVIRDFKTVYLHDKITNLCFCVVKYSAKQPIGHDTPITCVPCDSLKKVTIYEIK